MEKHVQIKREKPATRCEICHQSDLFDPKTETCVRCSQVEKALEVTPTISKSLWSPRFALLENNQLYANKLPPKILASLALGIVVSGIPLAIIFENEWLLKFIVCVVVIMGGVLFKYLDFNKTNNAPRMESFLKNEEQDSIITLFGEQKKNDQEPQITSLFESKNRNKRY